MVWVDRSSSRTVISIGTSGNSYDDSSNSLYNVLTPTSGFGATPKRKTSFNSGLCRVASRPTIVYSLRTASHKVQPVYEIQRWIARSDAVLLPYRLRNRRIWGMSPLFASRKAIEALQTLSSGW